MRAAAPNAREGHEKRGKQRVSRIAIALTAAAMMLALTAGVGLAMVVACTGGACEGTGKADVIFGSPNSDEIRARGDDDTVSAAQGGADLVEGNNGDDAIDVADFDGNDFVDCGRGTDVVRFNTVFNGPEDEIRRCEETTIIISD